MVRLEQGWGTETMERFVADSSSLGIMTHGWKHGRTNLDGWSWE